MIIEQKIRVVSEALARGMDRRAFIKRTGGVILAGMTTLVMGSTLGSKTQRASAAPLVPNAARCSPPGPYCNIDGQNEPSGCRGGSCYQHLVGGNLVSCQVYYQYYPGTGCWTTVDGNGYWTCCDCTCGGSNCGCAQYNTFGGIVTPD